MKTTKLFLGAIFSAIALLTESHVMAVPAISSQPTSQLETEVADSQDSLQEQFPDPSKFTGVAAEVDKVARQITVLIGSKNNGNGSGVIVAKQGNTYYVLTASHVVQKTDEYTLVAPDGQSYKLDNSQTTILEGVDLAVVRFSSTQTYSVATLGKYNLKDSIWVFVSGFPGSLQKSNQPPQRVLTGGRVWEKEATEFATKDTYSLTSGYGLLYTNLSVRGMSGGAVLDSRGYLIGINTAAENDWEITEEGQIVEISLGFSLGVPISTFVASADKAKIELNWLNLETSTPPDLTQSQVKELESSLLSLQAPSATANEFAWLNYGNQLWRIGEHQQAVTAFEQAIAKNPDFYQAYYGKGLALWYIDKDQEAVVAFERVTRLSPNFYPAWRYQGRILYELKKYQEALACYDKAIEINPSDFVLHVERGDVLIELKRYQEAVATYDKALKIKTHHWIYNNRGNTYAYLKDYQRAISDFNQAVELNPDYAETYNNRGVAYADLKDYQRAIADYNQAIALKPDYAVPYNNRGNTYVYLKDYQSAIADFNQAIELKPDEAYAYYNRGIVYTYLKEYQRAIADFNQAIALKPDYANA